MNSPIISTKYTGLLLLEGRDINPNGDPDNLGAPRTDPDTGHGLISPQATNYRVKRRVSSVFERKPPYDIQIRRDTSIEAGILQAAQDGDIDLTDEATREAKETSQTITKLVCKRHYDTRLGGGVLSVGSYPVEGVSGVVTMTWARSIYPVHVHDRSLTRVCVANEKQREKKDREMGSTAVVAHGVYKQPFFINPHHAAQNGATMLDLAIYLDSLINAYEHARSGMSGMVNVRGLWLFRHDSKFGNAPDHMLLDRIQVSSSAAENARSWEEYDLRFDAAGLPSTITVFTLEQLLGGHESILKTLTE